MEPKLRETLYRAFLIPHLINARDVADNARRKTKLRPFGILSLAEGRRARLGEPATNRAFA